MVHNLNKWGFRNKETDRWNHKWVIGGPAHKEYGNGLEREHMKNKIPIKLLEEPEVLA